MWLAINSYGKPLGSPRAFFAKKETEFMLMLGYYYLIIQVITHTYVW